MLTADRGYEIAELADVFLFLRLSSMIIVSYMHLKSNPFVSASVLKSGRDKEDEDDDDLEADVEIYHVHLVPKNQSI